MTTTTILEANEQTTINLALGRIFRIMSRPHRTGDVAEYERCRALILNTIDDSRTPYRPSWARDRMKGAAGD